MIYMQSHCYKGYNWKWKQRFLNANALYSLTPFPTKGGEFESRPTNSQKEVGTTTVACSAGNVPNSRVSSLF